MRTEKVAKVIRVLTLAPLVALVAVTIISFIKPDTVRGIGDYLLTLLFLTVLPLLGYPLQPLIPGFQGKGREGQRNLAIVMAVLGYILGIVYVLLSRATPTLLVIYLTYLLSGLGIVIFNKILKIRASGHACGVAGPIALLYFEIGKGALWGLLVIILVYWSSLKMKRHTLTQLLWGSAIPLVALLISIKCAY